MGKLYVSAENVISVQIPIRTELAHGYLNKTGRIELHFWKKTSLDGEAADMGAYIELELCWQLLN